ncbi:hypothetical protein GUJ93_ZPchr0012g19420 [Zizania palustris]|uniref:Amino acid transporter transmembrane domain-containing protein n=1 Tax=Zizania palustris TaxID=103762 RepID=A0A8J5WLG3_ZIZPA|nr:hypothetical protein GUJ93_ZPchr0012g19420 [Zizania palustris]
MDSLEAGNTGREPWLNDDDGRPRRTGTFWTACTHIITAVIGYNTLSLSWDMAQLGWVASPAIMLLFAIFICYTSTLQAECYLAIGYTIAASSNMRAIRRANCFHQNGHADPCQSSSNQYIILFGIVQIIFSQIPDFNQIWWRPIVTIVMSFTYSGISLYLGIAHTICLQPMVGFRAASLASASVPASARRRKYGLWRRLQAFSDMAFAYSFSNSLIEIQDTIKEAPPSEAEVMKSATRLSVATTTVLYMLCGGTGYAALGDAAPDNLLTGLGFYEPFWLLDIGNVVVTVHLVGAYQVLCQPFFVFIEHWASWQWPNNTFISHELRVGPFTLRVFSLIWRSALVCLTTVVAMLFPFFNNVVKLLGAVSFWPLTVYLPVEMYIAKHDVPRHSTIGGYPSRYLAPPASSSQSPPRRRGLCR